MADLVRNALDGRMFLLDDAVRAFVEAATDDARRKFARACAQLAVERAFAGDASNDKAVLRQALATKPPAPDVADAVEKLVDKLDGLGFDLNDKAEAGKATIEEYQAAYDKARAANAVWYVLSEDSLIAATEAAYEAGVAVGEDRIVEMAKQHPAT
jgi:hypothetical protein